MNEIALFEPERYELSAAPLYQFDLTLELNRRRFFEVVGCGLAVLLLVESDEAQESGFGRRGFRGGQRPMQIGAWLHVAEDDAVTVFTGKAEVGQNIRTSLAQAVAEELRTPVQKVRMLMADTERTPFDMGTFGSRSTPDMGRQLARVGAAAREALLDLAAEHFAIAAADRGRLQAADGKITHAGTAIGYGQLTKGQQLVKSVAAELALVPADKWAVAGMSVSKVDGREFVTGRHKYASDISRPGMLYGKVFRPAAFEATLESLDLGDAQAVEGVVAFRDGDFVGLAAPDELTAERALEAIHATWKTKPQPSSEELFAYLRDNTSQGGGGGGGRFGGRNVGSIEDGLAAADHQLKQTYTVAYIAHAPLEPRAAVAEWADGRLTVWTGTQRPFGVRGELAQAFGLAEDRVRVIVPDTGSGYGGKHSGEMAVEAARIARAAGKPVKLVWTREEEFTWAYFRPAGVIDVASGVRKDGTLIAWEFTNYNSGGSSINSPYEVPNQRIAFRPTKSPLRQGSYRALAATANTFARETHIDELAGAVGMDPLEFRRANLKDDRLRAVMEAAADAFGWGARKDEAGHGRGIAIGTEKGSYVATCAEVRANGNGALQVVRVAAAFECGAVVNPLHLKNQVEGAIVMGLGGALHEEIKFADGRISNPAFSGYRVPRFRDVPPIEVVLVNRQDLPSAGAGETPIIAIAPAIGNAIFAATGTRLRSLPLVPKGLG
ncbi:MAG TPA: molybdopterin cofactor-binding domain-containing protein [Pirellulales bacterium]|nr:molybdopterin cofactor-binding domain-containing protein [Pirellulales bacterium]